MFFQISGRVDRASATETVHSGSVPGRDKPKMIKIGNHSFPAWRSAIKRRYYASTVCGRQMGRGELDSKDRKVPWQSPGQGNLANKS